MFDIVAPGIVIGWVVWRYPELLDRVIPWLCFGILWHLTIEIGDVRVCKDKSRSAYQRWGKRPMSWLIAFGIGGCISLVYWYSVSYGLAELAARGKKLPAPSDTESHGTTDKVEAKAEHHDTDDKSQEKSKGNLPNSPKHKPPPRLAPEPQLQQPPANIVSPDPYVGKSNQVVAQLAKDLADRLERAGQKCQQDFSNAEQGRRNGMPIAPGNRGPEGVLMLFQRDFDAALRPGIIKIHQSIAFRLGPATLDARAESEYSDIINSSDWKNAWSLCVSITHYATPLRAMAQTLAATP